jgi:D-alanyl-D-alanine carboxypeptidase/D-alanyl-D-alanine-endopeptidase (penicillin-binding protein 4)
MRRTIIWLVALLAALAVGWLIWRGPAPPAPNPPASGGRMVNGSDVASGSSAVPENVLSGSDAAPDPEQPYDTPPPSVSAALESLADLPPLRSGTLGFYLAKLDAADQPLLTRDAARSFIPASTLKVITTGAALYLLGPDFRFETQLRHAPATGDVILRGGGDPSLGRNGEVDDLFNGWLDRLRRAGVREITGCVLADESAWETQEIPDGWTWADIGNYFAPFLTPLAFRDNEFRLWFQLGSSVGETAEFLDAEPWPRGLRFVNEMRTGPPGSGDNGYLYGGPGTDCHILRGTLPLDDGRFFSIRGALPDPALFCAQEFTDWLQLREVPVHGAATTTRRLNRAHPAPWDATTNLLASHHSAPLRELIIPINHRSLNLDCECLLRTLGNGRAANGLERILQLLEEHRLPQNGFQQTDGCGLARLNMITPELLARAVALFVNGEYGEAFLDSLPVAGESGTVRKIALDGDASGRLHVKSGHIERVKCYTGVVDAISGQRFVFAVMANNYHGESSPISEGIATLFDAMVGM